MRFKSFIVENTRSKKISCDEAMELLHKNCKDAVKGYENGYRIYRGNRIGIDDCMFIDPKKYTRKSAHTTNHYTLINDNSPYWKGYPKRSKSIVCTTDIDRASGYGNVYMVFPYDGSKIGICPDDDYWASFAYTTGHSYIADFINSIDLLLNMFSIPFDDSSYTKIKKSFKEFDKHLKNNKIGSDDLEKLLHDNFSEYDVNKYMTWLSDYSGNLLKTVEIVMNPKDNDFDLATTKTFYSGSKFENYREVWTDGQSILLYDRYDIDSII